LEQTKENTPEESEILLGWRPDLLVHATFLSDEPKSKFYADTPQQAMERNSPAYLAPEPGELARIPHEHNNPSHLGKERQQTVKAMHRDMLEL
jgi:hypothetical protein